MQRVFKHPQIFTDLLTLSQMYYPMHHNLPKPFRYAVGERILAELAECMRLVGKGPANTRGPALAQSRRYAVAVGGSQMCGSSWSMSRALWVGSRVSTSFRYA